MNLRTMEEVIEQRWQDFQPFLNEYQGDDVSATIAAIKAGFIPPHWTGWLHCINCGEWPCPQEQDGQRLLKCPWCKTIFGGLYRQMREDTEYWEAKVKALENLAKPNQPLK